MKKISNEHLTPETNTPLEVETKRAREEIYSGKFDIEELGSLMAALFLLTNKNLDGGVLEIKVDSVTKKERATVYQRSDHKPVFMTDEEIEIRYLQDPKRSLKMLITELDKRQATNKLIDNIQKDSTQLDPKKIN